MSRVDAAIQEGRCVLAFGGRALQPDVLMELRRRSVPAITLGSQPQNPVGVFDADAVGPVLSQVGAALVLIEPEAGDAKALQSLADLIAKSPNKPKLFVAAKAFNPFVLPMNLRLLKMEQIKEKAKDFVASLPVTAAAPVAAPAAQPEKKADRKAAAEPEAAGQKQAPRPLFVGREEELAQLGELLGADGGPILVVGAPGVGKRWLVEQALASTKLDRIADFTLGRGVGADALLGRIAAIAQDVGDDALAKALKDQDERPSPVDLARLAARMLQNPALAGKVWVIHELHRAQDRRDGSLHRMGRLELTLKELLLSTPALRLVFVSNQAVAFYREGEAANLRTLALAGIRGKELYQIFKSFHVEDTPRDRFGPISDRTLGHPMLVRSLALEVSEGNDLDELLKAPRFLKLESLTDLEPLRRHIKRKVEGLDAALMKALCLAAHLREPGTAAELVGLGVGRNERLSLLGLGMLEQTPGVEDRRFYVHPLVREHLDFQETSNFDLMESLASHYLELARDKAKPRSARLAWLQEAHRLLVEARRPTRNLVMPYPDQDALVDSVRGLIRRKQPRHDIARARLNEGLKVDPKNTELLILDAELKSEEKAAPEVVAAAWQRAADVAPTPEVFHSEASFHLDRNSRGKAAAALEKGIQLFPEDARMHRRLANLYLQQNRTEDAVTVLRRAMELEPMMPDAYGMLAEILVGRGPSQWEEAQNYLDEAIRLDPVRATHKLRLATLRRAQGMVDAEARATRWAEALEILGPVVAEDAENGLAHALKCALLLDQDGDLDQAEWLAKKAMKILETHEALVQRARVLIRRAAFEDADRLLDKAIKKEPSYHPAFAAKAELLIAQGQVFVALEHLKKARERSPKDAPDRVMYEADMARFAALIESGAAAELMKAAEASGAVVHGAEIPATEGERRDAGTTTRLRKRRRRGRGGGAAQAEGSEAAEGSDEAMQEGDLATEEGEPATTEEPASDEPASDEPAQAEAPEADPEAV